MATQTLPDQATFTIAEVAQITGFTKRSIEDACREGRITHRHFGRQRVLTREHLVAFIASTEEGGQPKKRAQSAELDELEKVRQRVGARLASKRKAAAR